MHQRGEGVIVRQGMVVMARTVGTGAFMAASMSLKALALATWPVTLAVGAVTAVAGTLGRMMMLARPEAVGVVGLLPAEFSLRHILGTLLPFVFLGNHIFFIVKHVNTPFSSG